MAGALRYLSTRILLVSHRTTTRRKSAFPQWQSPARKFSGTASRLADDSQRAGGIPTSSESEIDPRQVKTGFTIEDLDKEDRAKYDRSSAEEQQQVRDALRTLSDTDSLETPEPITEEMEADIAREVENIDREQPLRLGETRLRKGYQGFWADGEEDEFAQVEDDDDDFQDDDMTTPAHAQLDLHRDMREYQRRIAWDMPLLRKFAKPFAPPPLTSPLRFRYTTYMGEEHPAAKKVVVELCVSDLDQQGEDRRLTQVQRNKLIKLAGVRYNPSTDTIKMSSEKFETQAQNKRYLGDLVGKLIAEATDPTKDTFEDIPFDFRHHKPRKVFEFPQAWKLGGGDTAASSENVRRLVEIREHAAANRQKRILLHPPDRLQAHDTLDDDPAADADLDGDALVRQYLQGAAAHQAKLQARTAASSGRSNPGARQGGRRLF